MSRQQRDCSSPRAMTVAFGCFRCRVLFAGFLLISGFLGGADSASAAPFNILVYGNSFMLGGTFNVPTLVSQIAVAAGHDAPVFENPSIDGIGLGAHYLANTGPIGSLPPESWDFVVLQNYSTAPTHIDDGLNQHRTDVLNLYGAVANHSPNVVPVLFETWARGFGHELYTGPTPEFSGPAEMQDEVRNGYLLAADDLDASVGDSITRIAHVGSAFEAADFAANLYDPEGYHASDRGYLLSALVLYATIYGTPGIDEIDLGPILESLNLSQADGDELTQTAITVAAIPEPSTWVLLASAAGSLAAWRFRRRIV